MRNHVSATDLGLQAHGDYAGWHSAQPGKVCSHTLGGLKTCGHSDAAKKAFSLSPQGEGGCREPSGDS